MFKHKLAGVAGLLATLALTAGMALPAQAAKPEPISPATYTALGDSFAAGFGAGTPINLSYQSAQAYPVVLAGGPNLNFLALGVGGTTQVVASQVASGAVPATTQQVTLTVGGNDLGFVQKATACFTVAAACALTEADLANLDTLTSSLSALLAAIHTAAPDATIYVTGYPLLFQATQTEGDTGVCIAGTTPAGPLAITEVQADTLDGAALALNAAIRSAIAGPTHRYAKYVDVTAAFTGHGLCGTPSATSWTINPDSQINPVVITATGLDVMSGPLHPNAAGQQSYAASIQTKGFKG